MSAVCLSTHRSLCPNHRRGVDAVSDLAGVLMMLRTFQESVVDEEIRLQIGLGVAVGVLAQVRYALLRKNVLRQKEVARGLVARTSDDGVGRIGDELGLTRAGHRLLAP